MSNISVSSFCFHSSIVFNLNFPSFLNIRIVHLMSPPILQQIHTNAVAIFRRTLQSRIDIELLCYSFHQVSATARKRDKETTLLVFGFTLKLTNSIWLPDVNVFTIFINLANENCSSLLTSWMSKEKHFSYDLAGDADENIHRYIYIHKSNLKCDYEKI